MIHTNHKKTKGEEGVENKNELKLSIPEVKKYCQKELIMVRGEIEDILERATNNSSTNEAFYDAILNYLDDRVERLDDEELEIKFDAKTLVINEVEIYPSTLIISWTCNMGIGQCILTHSIHSQKWNVESEGMSEYFVRELLKKTFEKLIIE